MFIVEQKGAPIPAPMSEVVILEKKANMNTNYFAFSFFSPSCPQIKPPLLQPQNYLSSHSRRSQKSQKTAALSHSKTSNHQVSRSPSQATMGSSSTGSVYPPSNYV